MEAVRAKIKADQEYAANLKAEFVYSQDEVMRPSGLFWVTFSTATYILTITKMHSICHNVG